MAQLTQHVDGQLPTAAPAPSQPARAAAAQIAPGIPLWAVAVFCRNEGDTVGACLHALARAGCSAGVAERRPRVTVLLNGSTDKSAAAAAAALRSAGLRGRIYAIPLADKSNAINQYVHVLRPPAASTYFFVDAYAAVAPGALHRLASRLDATPDALAAAAVPSTGRSAAALARSMLAYPGLHGSLFALRGSFVDRLAASGLRLPVGLYRGDGLLGSLVMHDLDAAGEWEAPRVVVDPAATWTMRPLRPWRWKDLGRQCSRLVRQGRGRLEAAAVRDVIYRQGFQGLPATADDLVSRWIAAEPAARAPRALRDPLAYVALRQMRRARIRLEPSQLVAHLVVQAPRDACAEGGA